MSQTQSAEFILFTSDALLEGTLERYFQHIRASGSRVRVLPALEYQSVLLTPHGMFYGSREMNSYFHAVVGH